MNRTEALNRLASETFDLLVIGGGATGAGVALEAASRNLKVALVETGDFGSQTSSRSTKLLHGGVRYLEAAIRSFDRAQLNLVRDALAERTRLLRAAPHLANRLGLVTPLYRRLEAPYYWTGLKMYDLLSGRAGIGASHYLSRDAALKEAPRLAQKGLKGGVLYYDGQFDDARMNLAIMISAAEQGAAVANYARVVAIGPQSAQVRDTLSEGSFEVHFRALVNATGPFVDELRKLEDPTSEPVLSPSSGVHLVAKGGITGPDTGILIPRTDDGRVIFVLPWLGHTLIGTTDEPSPAIYDPKPTDAEISYLLEQTGRYLEPPLITGDIKAAWSGIRPLVKDPRHSDTAGLVRDHVILTSPSGMLTVAGGKWTTFRKMAQDVVDHLAKREGFPPVGASRSAHMTLAGGENFNPEGYRILINDFALDQDVAQHLQHNYGSRAIGVAQLAIKEGLLERIHPEFPYLEAEILWAAQNEYAQTPEDFLARRIRMAFLDQAAAESVQARVAELLG